MWHSVESKNPSVLAIRLAYSHFHSQLTNRKSYVIYVCVFPISSQVHILTCRHKVGPGQAHQWLTETPCGCKSSSLLFILHWYYFTMNMHGLCHLKMKNKKWSKQLQNQCGLQARHYTGPFTWTTSHEPAPSSNPKWATWGLKRKHSWQVTEARFENRTVWPESHAQIVPKRAFFFSWTR